LRDNKAEFMRGVDSAPAEVVTRGGIYLGGWP
jgi:hypothetical protein